MWIKYRVPIPAVEQNSIEGYYCTCRSGARTLGTCAHVASVLWYLGYTRHQQNIRYPSTILLNVILDAANSPLPNDYDVMKDDE